ncbi:LacI family DNA-binding transcriptional regulator [Thermosipho atlanticus]|uniref:Transcriptional regulator, LacI family n=1 Tax=Thermosipho atlanticus DSM 15807 TaxID=1123380 RepID=A0A1M5TBF9_9BACT|nr:LacI family DNA-binding transcriptional regulator [Thermosipho atlanticus]SHH48048.1 transcriptional regulator, LacI family [Thermosipho atlanticus DSM 15807]
MKIKDIAKIAGVSVATVSRVINNSPKVRPETREKILKIIEEYKYEPDHFAKSLRKRQSNIIGILLLRNSLSTEDSYTNPFLSGALEYLFHHDLKLVLDSCDTRNNLLHYKKLIKSKLVSGFIITDLREDDERIEYLNSINFPYVVIGRNKKNNFIYIDPDNEQGGYLGVEHLVEIGCKKILYISGSKGPVVTEQRLTGVLKAKEKFNVEITIKYGDFSKESGYMIAKKAKLEKYDGIFCASDLMAYGVFNYMKEKNIEKPLIGFDDLPSSKILGITSINQKIFDVGFNAAKMLHKIINKEKVKSMLLPVEISARESTLKFKK